MQIKSSAMCFEVFRNIQISHLQYSKETYRYMVDDFNTFSVLVKDFFNRFFYFEDSLLRFQRMDSLYLLNLASCTTARQQFLL